MTILRKNDWVLGLSVAVVVALISAAGHLNTVEHWGYDLGMSLGLYKPAHPSVVVVAIDDASIEVLGPWPWTRDVLASVQRKLNQAKPRRVIYTLSFEAANNERGLQIMGEFRSEHNRRMSSTLRREFQRAVNRLDTDHVLGASFRSAGNVILELPYELASSVEQEALGMPPQLRRRFLPKDSPSQFGEFSDMPRFWQPGKVLHLDKLYLPTEKIGAVIAGLGPSSLGDETDGPRALPLLSRFRSQWLPSLPLRVVLADKRVAPKSVKLNANGIKAGPVEYRTDNAGRVFPHFYKSNTSVAAIPTYSFAAIQNGTVPISQFRNKIIVLGLTANRFVTYLDVPLGQAMAPPMVTAQHISALLNQDFYALNESSYAFRYSAFVIVALYLMLLLPRFSFSTGLVSTLFLFALLLVTQIYMMIFQSLWTPLMSAAALLLGGHVLMMFKISINAQLQAYQGQLADSNRTLGQNLQAQGQLDQAFAKFRLCPASEETSQLLYNLALDFERKRQYNKAVEVLKHIAQIQRGYRDVALRIQKNEDLSNVVVLGKGGSPESTAIIFANDGVQKPVLGRYEIIKELGRGAMGMVYLGRDPKISRTVAIKTLSFEDEIGAAELKQVKARFFREAEAAGRLSHPNIVTVYDVGEDQDLCYIAMDYLSGQDLSKYTAPRKLLKVDEIVKIAIQVVEALHYAHSKKVVHRDIKPGNILFDRDLGHAVVTDFGVAILTDASKTKTGTILGSPAYMSPEQLAGHKVDGRSDLFSLGVTIYHLLSGQLPFNGDSLSNLMYKITHEKHKNLSKLRSKLPSELVAIINKVLQKNASKRYANGEQMAVALRRCI